MARSDNLTGAGLMMLAMAGYVFNDALVKKALEELNTFQAIFLRGLVVTSLLVVLATRSRVNWRTVRINGPLGLRVTAEVGGTVAFLMALQNMPIANVTAVLQVVPLIVTVGAAVLLGERVGVSRYVALGTGFLGVLLILRPDAGGFNVFALLALVAVGAVTIRDFATRRLDPQLPSAAVAVLTAAAITTLGGVVSIFVGWEAINLELLALLAGAAVFLAMGYYFSVATVRVGDLSFTAPFRYSIMVWAIVLGIVVLGEYPDRWTIAGTVLIVAAGIYSLARERTQKRPTTMIA